MFVLGHVGIGTRMLGPLRRRFPQWPLVLGCVLPDLVDKPIFYAMMWIHGSRIAPFLGSRSVGHTLIFLALLAIFPKTRAVAVGVATHFVLDIGGELYTGATPDSSIWLALLWPALGWNFPYAHFGSALEHLWLSARNIYVVGGEIVGGLILLTSWIRSRPS